MWDDSWFDEWGVACVDSRRITSKKGFRETFIEMARRIEGCIGFIVTVELQDTLLFRVRKLWITFIERGRIIHVVHCMLRIWITDETLLNELLVGWVRVYVSLKCRCGILIWSCWMLGWLGGDTLSDLSAWLGNERCLSRGDMIIRGDNIAAVYVLLQQILIVGVICTSTTRDESAILLLS